MHTLLQFHNLKPPLCTSQPQPPSNHLTPKLNQQPNHNHHQATNPRLHPSNQTTQPIRKSPISAMPTPTNHLQITSRNQPVLSLSSTIKYTARISSSFKAVLPSNLQTLAREEKKNQKRKEMKRRDRTKACASITVATVLAVDAASHHQPARVRALPGIATQPS